MDLDFSLWSNPWLPVIIKGKRSVVSLSEFRNVWESVTDIDVPVVPKLCLILFLSNVTASLGINPDQFRLYGGLLQHPDPVAKAPINPLMVIRSQSGNGMALDPSIDQWSDADMAIALITTYVGHMGGFTGCNVGYGGSAVAPEWLNKNLEFTGQTIGQILAKLAVPLMRYKWDDPLSMVDDEYLHPRVLVRCDRDGLHTAAGPKRSRPSSVSHGWIGDKNWPTRWCGNQIDGVRRFLISRSTSNGFLGAWEA